MIESLKDINKQLTLKDSSNIGYFKQWIVNDKLIITRATIIYYKDTSKPLKNASIMILEERLHILLDKCISMYKRV